MSLGGVQLNQLLGRKRVQPVPVVFGQSPPWLDRTLLLDAQAGSPEGRDSAERAAEA